MIFDKQSSQHFWPLIRLLAQRIRSDSLLRNSTYIMGTTIATSAIGYLYWIVAAHIYSTQDVGLASAIIAVMMLTATLTNLGIDSTLVHMLPRRETGYAWSLTLNAGLAMGALAGLLAGSIVVVALPLFFSRQFAVFGRYPAYTFVFVAGVPLWIIATLLDQTFVAERAANNMLLRNTAFAVFKLLLMVLLFQWGALGIFSSLVLAVAATLIGGWLLLIPCLKRAYCLAVRGIIGQVRTMLSLLAWNHFINIGGLMPMYLLPIFVTVRLSAADNAYYYTTSMVGTFFFMISSAVAAALFAEGSHATDNVLHKTRSSAVIIGILLVPAMLAVFLAGRSIMGLFGPEYVQHSLQLLTIFTIAAVPDAITNIYVSVLRVQKRLQRAMLLNLGMASLTLLLSWVLLPILGITGTGWAFLAAQIAGSLVAGADVISFYFFSSSPFAAARGGKRTI
jgi:O-antigen/teichoic acid export membrane protein